MRFYFLFSISNTFSFIIFISWFCLLHSCRLHQFLHVACSLWHSSDFILYCLQCIIKFYYCNLNSVRFFMCFISLLFHFYLSLHHLSFQFRHCGPSLYFIYYLIEFIFLKIYWQQKTCMIDPRDKVKTKIHLSCSLFTRT